MNSLHELIRRLPPRIEFLVVVTWAFGLPIFSSILAIGAPPLANDIFSTANLVGVLVFELAKSLFLVWFLRIRGWTLEKIGLQMTLRGTLLGLALLAGVVGLWLGVEYVGARYMPEQLLAAESRLPDSSSNAGMSLLFLVSVVSGIFEEVFVVGYVITALTPVRGMWTAINVSTGVRLLCHLYQGPLGILAVVPMGLLFGYTYARTRLLWPLILAHIVLDIIALVVR